MSTVDDLVTWLRAQLDHRERVALSVPEAARRWTHDGDTIHAGHPTDEVVDWVYYDGAWEHIALHNPARVLAEVDADRRILDLYEQTDFGDFARLTALEEVIRLRALPHADRPGYRDEWAPTSTSA